MTNKKLIDQDPWRNHFHIQPPTGLLNDPNGLIYHKGVYHVFYQWHPDAPVHGLKYWNHVTSSDLVTWKQDTRIINPDSIYDNHGAYSGSAYLIDDKIEIFYTGNHRDEEMNRVPYQVRTELTEAGFGPKVPLIVGPHEGYTDHYRDPVIFERDNLYYMIIGAQRTDLTGAAVLYTSKDGLNDWTFTYELKTPFVDFGYMWECPDLIAFGEQDLFIFCPQGAMNSPKYQRNLYSSAFALGNFNSEQGSFSTLNQLELLDYGFDFYATQSFLDENNNVTMTAWVGMPEVVYPTDHNGWAHVLSLPRILSVRNNELYQLPHPNLVKLRDQRSNNLMNHETYELKIANIQSSLSIYLYKSDLESLNLSYNHETKEVTLDRGNMVEQFAQEYGTQRILKTELHNLWIIRDTSTIEIFINSGRYTMTTRFFPQTLKGDIMIESSDDLTIELYTLKETNHDL